MMRAGRLIAAVGVGLVGMSMVVASSVAMAAEEAGTPRPKSNFAKPNIHAWAFLGFDPDKSRDAERRARMLKDLGFRQAGYEGHPHFMNQLNAHVEAFRRHGIELVGVYFPIRSEKPLEEEHIKTLLDVIRRKKIKPQLWAAIAAKQLESVPENRRVAKAAMLLYPLAVMARPLGVKVSLYNHGGWYGEPENQIAIIRRLRSQPNMDHVGMAYNFHHGHPHIERFEQVFPKMMPYLFTLNLNGMRAEGPKIITIGEGDREEAMIAFVRRSGYAGPIGIIDHQRKIDPAESFQKNFAGLKRILESIGDQAAAASY